jgi:uncharacterized protein (DUF488 family)
MTPVFTIGHSTRTGAELVALLRARGVQVLVDVRRYPVSRRHPQFGRDRLAAALGASGVTYVHEPDLGGHREPRPGSPNTALRDAFRGYADHMATADFAAALERLESRARAATVAVMCAEADPLKCHRRLLSDVLAHRGWAVRHVLGPAAVRDHVPTAGTRVGPDGALVYPAARLF